MSWSLNEIESLARKAARGAGFSWGLAEEAGYAARWLAGVNLPGPEALANLLIAQDGTAFSALRPTHTDVDTWQASGGTLCPISTGTALGDKARMLPAQCRLSDVAQPLLLVPFIAGAANIAQQTLFLEWPGAAFHVGSNLRGCVTTPFAQAQTVLLKQGGRTSLPLLRCQLRYDLAPGAAADLNNLAQRTYAPDTDASRLGGAGAGLSDND
ncbi:DUF3726 domain-containing protein [Roseovarius aestuarii]|nr:DUF3726 domain-containing protein [Roseovarius aestuarii]